MNLMPNFHFLTYKPNDCSIMITSDHSCRLGIFGSNDNPTHSPILYFGDKTEMWPGTSIILNEEIPITPIKVAGDGIIVDLTVIKKSINIGLPTCDCCPLIITDPEDRLALLHISTETLSLYKTAQNGSNGSKIPILHQVFSIMKPSDCIVQMGPCIRGCHYEFDRTDALLLAQQIKIHYPEANLDESHRPHYDDNKVYVNFPEIIIASMLSMGVRIENIDRKNCVCTVCESDPETGESWHSYRKSGNTDNHNWTLVNLNFPESLPKTQLCLFEGTT